ncbi:hypothetical protein XENOCAPTIV_019189 [Xenoophorus captivus]|uniref:Uncharacterized protein n=1 Tax=Xenoophorus captivus TaxID=1517983 RepID=A0ABV0Q3T4_9TELE
MIEVHPCIIFHQVMELQVQEETFIYTRRLQLYLQKGFKVPPQSSGSAPGSRSPWTCLEKLQKEASRTRPHYLYCRASKKEARLCLHPGFPSLSQITAHLCIAMARRYGSCLEEENPGYKQLK